MKENNTHVFNIRYCGHYICSLSDYCVIYKYIHFS